MAPGATAGNARRAALTSATAIAPLYEDILT
jgi:hypothetical protein